MLRNRISKFSFIYLIAFLLIFSSSYQVAFATQPEPDTPLNQKKLQRLTAFSEQRTKDGVIFDLGNYKGYIHVLSNDIVKISILPNNQAEKDSPAIVKKSWQTPNFETRKSNNQYTIKTINVSVIVSLKPFGVKILDKNGKVITEDYTGKNGPEGYENNKPYVFKKTDSSENFYGFGEQAGLTLNKRGKNLGMWNSDAFAYNQNTKYVYTAIPFFIGLRSGKAYGILFDNSNRTYYNMANESKDYYYFYANGGPLTYYFLNGPDISHVIDEYTDLTGKMKLPPQWALGFQQSKYGYSPTDIVNVAKTYRQKQIPLDTMNFDIDYMNGYRVFTWNPAYLKALKQLKSLGGFHAVVINDPGVKQDTNNYLPYMQGTQNDFWIKTTTGEAYVGPVWSGPSVFPNFLRSDVRSWWAGNIASNLLTNGVDGIWNDMNEPAVFNDVDGFNHTLPLDSYGLNDNGDDVLHTAFHNYYGHLEDEASYGAWAQNLPNVRPFVLTRDMFAGTQRYAAIWTGDSESNWEHLQRSIPMNENIGLSGVSFVGNDIGGFAGSKDTKKNAELFSRWIEVGAFTPFSRIHYGFGPYVHQEPWSFGSSAEQITKKYVQMRYQWLPYLYNAFKDSATTGAPVQQPLVYQFQNDPGTYNNNDQFMFGKSIMMAPVVNPKQRSRSVYLPKGANWIDYWTQKEYVGGQTIKNVSAPLDKLPIFIKANSIIPTREVQQYTDQRPLTNLVLDTYLDSKASNNFYEDDGKSFNYKSGNYNETQFSVKRNGQIITFSQNKQIHGYNSKIAQYKLALHNTSYPGTVTAGSRTYKDVSSQNEMTKTSRSYYYDAKTKTTYVNIPANESSTVNIVQGQFTGYLTKTHAVKGSPSTKGATITTLSAGSPVTVLQTGSWNKILYNGKAAYINGDVSKTQKVLYTGYLIRNHALRTSASSNGRVVKKLNAGSSVNVLQPGTWTKISDNRSSFYVWGADIRKSLFTGKLSNEHQFRKYASIKSPSMATLKKNTIVRVLSKGKYWTQVVYKGKLGYVWGKDIKKQ